MEKDVIYLLLLLAGVALVFLYFAIRSIKKSNNAQTQPKIDIVQQHIDSVKAKYAPLIEQSKKACEDAKKKRIELEQQISKKRNSNSNISNSNISNSNILLNTPKKSLSFAQVTSTISKSTKESLQKAIDKRVETATRRNDSAALEALESEQAQLNKMTVRDD